MTSNRRLGALLVSVILLAACSSTASSDAVEPAPSDSQGSATASEIVLEFPSFQFPEVPTNTWWKGLIAEFEASHPNVRIDWQDAPSGDYTQALATRFAANDPPQLVHMITRDFVSFAAQGWFDEIDSCFTDDTLKNLSGLQSYMSWDGQTLGFLLNSYAYHLYYNKALLDQAGVAVPTTFEELVEAANAVSAKTDAFGYAGTTATSDVKNVVEVSIFLTGFGVPWTVDGKYNVTSPEFTAAIEKYRTVLKAAPQGTTSNQIEETLFPTGKVAMTMDGNFYWSIALATASPEVKGSIGIAAVPFPVTAGSVSNSLHIPKGLAPDVKQAACEFIALAASPDWQGQYGETLTVPPPGGIATVSEDFVAQHPEIKLMAEQASKAHAILPTAPEILKNYGVFVKIVTDANVALTSTDGPTAQILQTLLDTLNSRIPLSSQ